MNNKQEVFDNKVQGLMDYARSTGDWGQVCSNKVQGLVDYIEKYNLQSLVLGISGGIDSTLTAVIASEACKKANIPLVGRSLPTYSNKSEEDETAKAVGELFCDDFEVVDITKLYLTYKDFIQENEDMSLGSIPKGNIKARLRMIYLYNLASMQGGIVLDTDNLTEHYMGFFTLHGDQGDVGVLGDLWKTEVFEFAKWCIDYLQLFADDYAKCTHPDRIEFGKKIEAKIKAIKASLALEPTDGNGTAPDLEQYGAPSFEIVDEILQALVACTELPKNEYVEVIKQRFLKSQFKRWHSPLNVNCKGEVTIASGTFLV